MFACDFRFSFLVINIWFLNIRNNFCTFNFLYKNLIFNFQDNLNSSSNNYSLQIYSELPIGIQRPRKQNFDSQQRKENHTMRKPNQWNNCIALDCIEFLIFLFFVFFSVEVHCTFEKTLNIEVGEEESFPWQSFIFCLPWVAGPTKIMGYFKANLFKPSKWKMRGKHCENSERCPGPCQSITLNV